MILDTKQQTATLGGGCFWCTEAVFKRLKGIISVTSGYSGGHTKNPHYETVSSGNSGHAEVIQIKFDSQKISFSQLLEVFWAVHDPTTPNRQGNDVGTQYRSIIFYHDAEQKQEAQKSINELQNTGKFADKIVTEVLPYKNFYLAEEYHQNFYDLNPDYPYCKLIIEPKIQKLLKNYSGSLKEEHTI